jgi:opacity protein-like surface antigen
MNKSSALLGAILALGISSASAQSQFEGYYGQVGVGYSSLKSSVSNSNLTAAQSGATQYGMSSSSSSAGGINSSIAGGYTWILAPKFTLGLGVDYQPIAGHAATSSLSNSTGLATSAPITPACTFCAPVAKTVTPSTISSSSQQTNAYALYVAPGYVIDDESLVYGKLGYAGTQIKTTLSGGSAQSANYKGYLVGIGYKRIISGDLYGFVESNYTAYGSQTQTSSGNLGNVTTYNISTTNKVSSYNTMIGVGYKF